VAYVNNFQQYDDDDDDDDDDTLTMRGGALEPAIVH